MSHKNIRIVREFVDQIFNAKRVDRLHDFFDESCIFNSAPYIGLGFVVDGSSNERLVVSKIAINGPANGLVEVGDELVRATDGQDAWEGYEELRKGLKGHDQLGSDLKLSVLRAGEVHEINLESGWVTGFNSSLAEMREMWQNMLLQEMPDLYTEIEQIFADRDMVAYFATNSATSESYHRTAVWSECNILRLKNGRIVEWWGIPDLLSQQKQFGFDITAPPEA